MSFIPPTTFHASSFSIFQQSLMQHDDLPMADVVDSQVFQRAFDEHAVDFGNEDDAAFAP